MKMLKTIKRLRCLSPVEKRFGCWNTGSINKSFVTSHPQICLSNLLICDSDHPSDATQHMLR